MRDHGLAEGCVSDQTYMDRQSSDAGRGPVFLTRDFRLVWLGQLVSQVGDGVSRLALLWFVYSVTGSPIKTTIVGLLQTIPPIVLGPFIGVFIDRLPKKPLLIATDILRAVLIGVIPCFIPTESFTVGALYVLVFFHAIATAVFGPTLIASVPFLVRRTQFTAANALLQGTTSLGIILGPALSGIGIAFSGSQEILCLNAVTYLASAACLLPIRLPGFSTLQSKFQRVRLSETVSDLLESFQFISRTQPAILLLVGVAALYSFGTSALTTLFPVFGRTLLDLGPMEVGYLWSALGFGLLAMSIALVRLSEWSLQKRIQVIAASSGLSGVAICAFIATKNIPLATVLMVIIGCGMGALTPIAWGITQELSPKGMMGRVLALYNTGAMTAAIVGIMSFGWISEHVGEAASVIGIGGVMLATAAVALQFSRKISVH